MSPFNIEKAFQKYLCLYHEDLYTYLTSHKINIWMNDKVKEIYLDWYNSYCDKIC